MTAFTSQEKEQGIVMVLSMIMLLVMTTMGIGLWYVADREIQQVTTTINRSETLYSAETCVEEAINWLRDEAAKGPPCKGCTPFTTIRTIPNSGNRKMNTPDWQVSSEGTKQRGKMASHEYRCTVKLITTVATQGQAGTGFDVGQSSSYGGSATQTKYLYQIRSYGLAPNNIRSDIEVIASIVSSL